MTSIVFKGLLRPPMQFGVPVMFFSLELIGGALLFLVTKDLFAFCFVIPVHTLGWIVSLHDPHLFHVAFTGCITVPRIRNRAFWGRQSYAG